MIRAVRFVGDTLFVSLSDGREVILLMGRVEWLAWLAKASPQQRSKWSIEPGDFAIFAQKETDMKILICQLKSRFV